MFKIFVYSLIILLTFNLFGCASKTDQIDPVLDASLNESMAILEKERKVDYGPSIKDEQNATAFLDHTKKFGLDGLSATSLVAVDLNLDGYTDLVLIDDYFSQPVFYLFDPSSSKFIKSESLFDDTLKASMLLFADLDGDRVLDALAGVLNQGTEVSERAIRVLKGYKTKKGLRFKERVSSLKLPPAPSATLGLLDFDVDGDLDIFVGNWFSKIKGSNSQSARSSSGAGATLPMMDALLENKGGDFIDRSELLLSEAELNVDKTMRVNATPTFSSQVCDVDFNGFPDILTSSTNGYLNKLWMNRYRSRGESRYFKNYGVESGYAGDPDGILNSRGGGRSFSGVCADYNNDGIMDIFAGEVSHNHDADSLDKSSILTGSTRKFPPKFLRTEYVLDAHDLRWNQADKRGIWFDYNNDGLLDLWVDNSGYPPHTRALLFKQYPDHSFENVAKTAGIDIVNPQSSIILDVNRDGLMDVLTAQTSLRDARIKKRLYLFVNNSKNPKESANRSARFFLRGNSSNYWGIGATIELKVQTSAGIERRLQSVSYSYGGLSPQNEEGVLFGLKAGEKLLGAKVIWPYSKSLNTGRGTMERFYNLKKFHSDSSTNITLCEVGLALKGKKECPIL